MGIPKYFRSISERFPLINQTINMGLRPEIDCLYLDMNGIVHTATHANGNNDIDQLSEAQMFLQIFQYIEQLIELAQPQQLLYMALDGVAPRAKMNQQRQRRFRAVQERQESEQLETHLRQIFHDQGRGHDLPGKKAPAWDSNVITPGTPFMANLSESLRYYIADRLQNDPGWAGIQVIFSDATVPGEGEHKIMHFIRNQRSQVNYDPNIRHCLYGMDADLIMLSLSSHEPHFYIVREIVYGRNEMICTTCGKAGHHSGECIGIDQETIIKYANTSLDNYLSKDELNKLIVNNPNAVINLRKRNNVPYQFLSIPILREYLNQELHFPSRLFNLENAIDDWVFLCFFVGNDFLPHMPALEIRENAIGLLQKIWKSIMLAKIKGFESEIINNYISTLPPTQRQRIDPNSLNTTQIPDSFQIPIEIVENYKKKIYITSNGELILEHVFDFISKFQIFESAILFSRGKRDGDRDAKDLREKLRKQQDEAMVAQLDEDNAKIMETITMVE
jgi:5'-3' exonuclease